MLRLISFQSLIPNYSGATVLKYYSNPIVISGLYYCSTTKALTETPKISITPISEHKNLT